MALVATTTTGPGILHQLTGVIARHQGDIASVEILEGGPEASRTYLEIKLPDGADALLAEVGLGYLKLGQAATTLSGGEAQRVKLAAELGRKSRGRTLYLLDEPTTGLHFHDVSKLLEVLFKLRVYGNTLIVIEHNLDVIKTADWVIDLGPEGGAGGGEIIAQGPPEVIAACNRSHTGRYRSKVLNAAR